MAQAIFLSDFHQGEYGIILVFPRGGAVFAVSTLIEQKSENFVKLLIKQICIAL